jgi:lipopolysaccharide biosynthesis glycosyltransferase
VIEVFLASDARCVLGAAATMRSIIDSAPTGTPFRFHVMCHGVRAADRRKLEAVPFADEPQVSVRLAMFDTSRTSHLIRSRLVTHMTYSSLFVGDLMPSEVTRCLKVDTDVIFTRDVTELWNTPLGNHTIGAVSDPGDEAVRQYQRRLGLKEPRYFNAGIQLIDLSKWRARKVTERALKIAEQIGDALVLHDQDALNCALEGDWLSLDWHWNVWVIDPALREDSAAVIHYMGAPKPWHVDYDRRFQAAFIESLDRTPFAGTRPANPLGMGAHLTRLRRKIPYLPSVLRILRMTLRGERVKPVPHERSAPGNS